jgi:hypothetical protein
VTPDAMDALDDETFDAMVRLMQREADAIERAQSKARR